MYFPHFLRNISRIKANGEKIAKTIVIGLIFTGIAYSLADYRPNINLGPREKSVQFANVNLYLRQALDHFEKYLASNDEEDLKKTVEKLKAFLEVDPTNPYALRLARTLKVDNRYEIDQQIPKTLEVLEERPDYAAAWLRLSMLYKQKGEDSLAEDALREAKKYGLGW
ncbi:hypothetical protein HYS90_01195 [Candidatus Curtissbacteria bacterium]|nr:hypothetical protein [Candidatus Curtissbacteria bacterium]